MKGPKYTFSERRLEVDGKLSRRLSGQESHRKKHSKVGVEEDVNGTTTVRYTSDEIVENNTRKDGKEETKIIVPDHREAKQPIKQA